MPRPYRAALPQSAELRWRTQPTAASVMAKSETRVSLRSWGSETRVSFRWGAGGGVVIRRASRIAGEVYRLYLARVG